MALVWLKLQGEGGDKPKAPASRKWADPDYTGIKPVKGEWTGLRTDGMVVVDCDSADAAGKWLEIDPLAGETTLVRQTPRGFHFFYAWSPGSPEGPSVGVYEGIDIRAGHTSQVVYFAPGYSTISDVQLDPKLSQLVTFQPDWVPTERGPLFVDPRGWSEMPYGVGNVTMTSIAGTLRKVGMNQRTIRSILMGINKLVMTESPMPADEVRLIARSVCRYEAEGEIGDIELLDE